MKDRFRLFHFTLKWWEWDLEWRFALPLSRQIERMYKTMQPPAQEWKQIKGTQTEHIKNKFKGKQT